MNTHDTFRILGSAAVASVLWLGVGCSSDNGTTAPTLPPTSDEAPPLSPTGLHVPKADGKGCAVVWTPGAEADLAGYRVYVYDPDPTRATAYTQLTNGTIGRNSYVFVPSASMGTQESYFLRVTAVDESGNESALSELLEVRIGAAAPPEDAQQDPGVDSTEPSDGVFGNLESPGVPGRNPSIEQPERH